jgi:TolB protein
MTRVIALTVVALALLAGSAGAGSRAFEGKNGRMLLAGADGYIYSVTGEGTGLQRLIAGRAPAWAPGGRRFAFVRFDQIWIANTTGTRLLLLPKSRIGGADAQPSWSPDGKRLVFVHVKGNRSSVQLVDLTRGRRVQIVKPSTNFVYTPSWSPDGKRIVFTRLEDDDTTQLYSVRPDGRRLTRLTRAPVSSAEAAWSPDGKQIVFVRSNFGPAKLYVMRADGSRVRRLIAGRVDDVEPAWSPDGRLIAFARKPAARDDRELYVVDLSSKVVRRLTQGMPSVGRIDWQPIVPRT